ncbi:MAG: substrate-binding domain-containing protein, partial [Lentisphaeria bacterium]|nr:substrate-binding domain-containing protein [Lentisphaeria bacterium]
MKKLFFSLSLPLLLLLSLGTLFLASSCGKQQKKTVIGVSITSADHGWTGGIVYWAEMAAKVLEKKYPDVTIRVSTSADSSEQVSQIENMLIQDIKALVVLPHEPAPLAGICKKAKEKKVFLTVVDRNLAGNIEDLAVAGDNPGFGRACAEAMAKQLDYKGDIVVMEGVLCDVNTQRVEAFRSVMKKYPNIRILDSQTANWNTEQGLKLMET